MKVKLDENVPAALKGMLEQQGHDTITVPQEGLAGRCDAAIWEAAQAEDRLLITMDLDFADIRRFSPGTHGGLLILRPPRHGRRSISALLKAVVAQHPLESFKGCIVISDERTIRVRKP